MNYKFLEHTADLSIRVFGNDLSEIICNSVFATADLIYPVKRLSKNARTGRNYSFVSREEMLVKILTDVINEFELNLTLYFCCDSLEIKEKSAFISMSGHAFTRMPSVRNVLKSATYHDLSMNAVNGHVDLTFDL
ncbi:MAG: archease [Candidatus Thermoplasmatota archaeon]|nr:archease [Candidatus Thermoplasmatota archaeon]